MRYWLLAAVTVLLAATWTAARQGVVRTSDGQVFEGQVEQKEGVVQVTIRGIPVIIEQERVASIEYPPPFEEQFAQRLRALEPSDAKGRVELARWAFDSRRYDLARKVLEEAVQADPSHREAWEMLSMVRRQVRLEAATQSSTAAAATQPVRVEAVHKQERVLGPEDINRIRQMELKSTDPQVRIRFDNNVEQRFIVATGQNAAAFRSLRPYERALLIFQKGEPSLREDVRILDDPLAIRQFRRDIQRMVLSGCAAVNCHGGPEGGPLVLITSAETEAAAYTNFFILQNYTKSLPAPEETVFGSATVLRLINRTHPEQSLLLQYGLPAQLAEQKHPSVANWRPFFSGKGDVRYRQMLQWISQSLARIEPQYEIDYVPPTGIAGYKAATQPATTQSSMEPQRTQEQ